MFTENVYYYNYEKIYYKKTTWFLVKIQVLFIKALGKNLKPRAHQNEKITPGDVERSFSYTTNIVTNIRQ